MRRLLERAGTTDVSPWISKALDAAKPISSEEFSALLEELDNFRSEMLQFMEDYDVILSPVVAYPAPSHGPISPEHEETSAYNLTGWPGAVVPSRDIE